MKQTLDVTDFRRAFRTMDRYDQFGYETLGLIFDYLEEVDPDMELDVIAVCCDYSVNSVEDIAAAYSIDADDVVDFLNDKSYIVGVCADGRIVYCSAF